LLRAQCLIGRGKRQRARRLPQRSCTVNGATHEHKKDESGVCERETEALKKRGGEEVRGKSAGWAASGVDRGGRWGGNSIHRVEGAWEDEKGLRLEEQKTQGVPKGNWGLNRQYSEELLWGEA